MLRIAATQPGSRLRPGIQTSAPPTSPARFLGSPVEDLTLEDAPRRTPAARPARSRSYRASSGRAAGGSGPGLLSARRLGRGRGRGRAAGDVWQAGMGGGLRAAGCWRGGLRALGSGATPHSAQPLEEVTGWSPPPRALQERGEKGGQEGGETAARRGGGAEGEGKGGRGVEERLQRAGGGEGRGGQRWGGGEEEQGAEPDLSGGTSLGA